MNKATLIRVECEDCGEVCVTMVALTLRMCVDNERWTCCFRCPVCARATTRELDWRSVDQLVACGASVQRWHLPAELIESRPAAPVLTLDDLLDFHLLMERTNWLDDALGRSDAGA
jgi:hypothetical protein